MRCRLLICGFVVLVTAAGAAAQEVDTTVLFPIVARTAGVGTSQWVTDLTVHSLVDQPVEVGLQFFPADQANTFNFIFPDRISVGPRGTVLVEDVLASVFGYQDDITGVLLVTAEQDFIPGNPEDSEILAVTRTYNAADPAGTYGQTVPALFAAATGISDPVVATGARNDSRFRSNVGIVSMSFSGVVTVHYRILDGDGNVLAQGSKPIPSLTVKQWRMNQLGVGSVTGPLTVELWLDPADVSIDPCADFANRILGYVSKVDNGTGDAEFLYAAPVNSADCGW
jgi:hypothetical protein